ncbi:MULTISPECIES: hypothetical protein [unclassified Pseudomonas]|uniref:hypothetical protein n=1 Tax=unclassified Pseudomonas TaxID=196821 RepID=UPI002AC98101|nr:MULTISPECIES: hypothetical protein [unclassified Pseudomonas]MEB0160808.1 hypothetical protein [Pseudomonas sp. AH2 (2023)]WPX27682.1 hypothetical protein RHM64_22790 [Pseudomonas sp. AH2]
MRVIFLLAALSISFAVHASEVKNTDPCSRTNKLMTGFMRARQAGMPKARVYQVVDSQAQDQKLRLETKKIVDLAYRHPIYPTREEKQNALRDAVGPVICSERLRNDRLLKLIL